VRDTVSIISPDIFLLGHLVLVYGAIRVVSFKLQAGYFPNPISDEQQACKCCMTTPFGRTT
jgi:hypothetical protein